MRGLTFDEGLAAIYIALHLDTLRHLSGSRAATVRGNFESCNGDDEMFYHVAEECAERASAAVLWAADGNRGFMRQRGISDRKLVAETVNHLIASHGEQWTLAGSNGWKAAAVAAFRELSTEAAPA